MAQYLLYLIGISGKDGGHPGINIENKLKLCGSKKAQLFDQIADETGYLILLPGHGQLIHIYLGIVKDIPDLLRSAVSRFLNGDQITSSLFVSLGA